MADYDPERKYLYDMLEGLYETLESMNNIPMEKIEKLSRVKTQMMGIIEDIFSLDVSERSRDAVEKAVKNFVDRQGGIVWMNDDLTQRVINYLCSVFRISV